MADAFIPPTWEQPVWTLRPGARGKTAAQRMQYLQSTAQRLSRVRQEGDVIHVILLERLYRLALLAYTDPFTTRGN